MRVAVVSPYSLDVPGGVQGQAVGLSAALADVGVEVLLVAPGTPAGVTGVSFDVVRVGGPWSVAVNGSRAPVAPYPAAWQRTARALRSFRPDVVHVHEPLVPGPSLAALLRPVAPLIGTFHRAGEGAIYRRLRPVLRPLAAHLSVVVTVSAAASETLRHALGSDLSVSAVLANAVDLDRFSRATPHATEGPTAVFVGRHEPRKGLRVLLDAFDVLPPEARLWVIGDGPETHELRGRVRDDKRVRWLGAVPDDALASWIGGADVLVAPSLEGESFGVVLLEAMAAGTAVIASDLAGYRLAADAAARFVAPGDPDVLSAAIADLLADGRARASLVARGHEQASSHSFAALAQSYLTLYDRACSSDAP